jgi:hypothetical protein
MARRSVRPHWAAGLAAAHAKADEYAASLAPHRRRIRSAGTVTLTGIAKELTNRRVRTPRGGTWTSTIVRRLLERLGVARSRRRKS